MKCNLRHCRSRAIIFGILAYLIIVWGPSYVWEHLITFLPDYFFETPSRKSVRGHYEWAINATHFIAAVITSITTVLYTVCSFDPQVHPERWYE